MARLVLALLVVAGCSFDPAGVELGLDGDARAPAVVDAAAGPDGPEDAAEAAVPDAGAPPPDAEAGRCGDVGEDCCDEQPICRGLAVCLNGTCAL